MADTNLPTVGSNNYYLGTKGGALTKFGQDDLGTADAGSINYANVDGAGFQGTAASTSPGFNFSNGLGAAQIGLGALNAYTGFQNYKLQKEALAANIENANRNYEAEKTKYNNAVARTEAVNKHFGSENVTARI